MPTLRRHLMAQPRYSIIMPARNEEKRIGRTLERYVRFFRGKGGFEIYVIMDSCRDNTLGVVKGFAKKYPQVKYRYFEGRMGKGGAIIEGIRLVTGELVVYVDADGATPPEEIPELAGKIGNYDGVMGSRWIKGARIVKKQPLGRIIASRGFNMLVRLILGLPYRDTQCPAKVFRSRVIKGVIDGVQEKNFAFDACLLYFMKKKGYIVREVPIEWRDVEHSTLRMRSAVPRMFLAILRTRLRDILE